MAPRLTSHGSIITEEIFTRSISLYATILIPLIPSMSANRDKILTTTMESKRLMGESPETSLVLGKRTTLDTSLFIAATFICQGVWGCGLMGSRRMDSVKEFPLPPNSG